MPEKTSEAIEQWASDLNKIADEFEWAWSDELGVQISEKLREYARSIKELASGAQSLEDTLNNCMLYCEEIMSEETEDSSKTRVLKK